MHTHSLAGAICLLLIALSAQATEPLRFGTFTNINAPGLVACERVLREAYAKLGHSITVEHLPAQRSLYWAETGRLDGDLCRALPYANLIRVPTPILHWKLTAFSTRKLEINSWSDLKPFTVGYERGMTIIAQHSELTLQPANSIESAILQASKGRVDLLLNDDLTGRYNIRRMGIDNLIANETPLAPGPVFHLLNSKHQMLAEQLNSVLLEMAATDRIGQIRDEVMQEFLYQADQENLQEQP
jgi:polar amino acid transport system substrate-binding protein